MVALVFMILLNCSSYLIPHFFIISFYFYVNSIIKINHLHTHMLKFLSVFRKKALKSLGLSESTHTHLN